MPETKEVRPLPSVSPLAQVKAEGMSNLTPDDSTLVAEATASHNCVFVSALRPGGQKLVVRVRTAASDDAVLKIARVDGTATAEALTRAEREAALLASVSHPNIVKGLAPAVALGSPPYAICWLEEYLDGEDLRDLVGSPWPWTDVYELGTNVAAGLAELHARAIVHRDLSAGNVRRLQSGPFKILDPGFARHLNLSGVTGLAQPGTPGFLSPEHVQLGIVPSPASDIFALGILLWLTLAGELPVPFHDPVQYTNDLAGGQVPSILTRRSDLDAGAAQVVDRCLQRQIARRYFDGAEALAALEAL